MKILVTFRHLPPDDQIREYLEEKLQRLGRKYFHRPKEAEVILTAEKFRRIAEITVWADQKSITAKEETEDLKSAVDLALDKVEIQARRYRTRVKDRKKGAGEEERPRPEEIAQESSETNEEEVPEVVEEDRFIPKPISVEDALLLLKEKNDHLVMFRDADTMKVCVLYKREDGKFGLVEAAS